MPTSLPPGLEHVGTGPSSVTEDTRGREERFECQPTPESVAGARPCDMTVATTSYRVASIDPKLEGRRNGEVYSATAVKPATPPGCRARP
jgi:hypothetical protein